jgi:hypothetical protein
VYHPRGRSGGALLRSFGQLLVQEVLLQLVLLDYLRGLLAIAQTPRGKRALHGPRRHDQPFGTQLGRETRRADAGSLLGEELADPRVPHGRHIGGRRERRAVDGAPDVTPHGITRNAECYGDSAEAGSGGAKIPELLEDIGVEAVHAS